jgi:dolichol-phosphate mannosyltransferase
MRRPLPVFLCVLAACLAVLAGSWLPQTGSSGELLGHAAKIEAILRLLRTGDFAWFPDYLTGSPSATLLSFALSVPVYAPGLLLASNPVIGMKITALVLFGLGGLAAFAFGRRLARDGWTGFAVGSAYLLAPQLLQRIGWQEHMTIVVVIPLVPLCFLALLRVADRGTPWDGVLLGVAFSAALLAWSKMGATLAIPLALFAAWQFLTRPECRTHLLRGALWAVPTVLLLGVLPLLPLLRERAFMTVFELDPLRAWQGIYSVRTATSWFDRAGELFAPLARSDRMDRGGYYLGLVGFLAVAVTIFLTWSPLRRSREVAAIRFFLLIALAMFWISFGPRSVIIGHFEFLSRAQEFADLGIPLHWLALAAQGVLLFWCLSITRWRVPIFCVVFAIYLFVPAFRLLERFPLYSDLRAPDSFWILNGTFAWAVASALAVVFVLRAVPNPRLRPIFAAIAFAAAVADISPYFASFSKPGLSAGLFAKYREITAKLHGPSDRVFAISGRYFYLDLPNTTGRPLSSEALNRYLMPKHTARLQSAAQSSATDMISYLRLAGISDVFIERRDPDVSGNFQRWFRAMLPLRFENDAFFVLSNPSPLHPGFFAESAVPADANNGQYVQALSLAQTHHLAVANLDDLPLDSLPGMKSPAEAAAAPGPDFTRLQLAGPRTPATVTFSAPGRAGWIVLDESWHPDWKALVDGVPKPVYRAAGAFPATPISAATHRVEFQFRPPAWYSGCLATASISWLAALGFLVAVPLLPASVRRKLWAPSPAAPLRVDPNAPRPAVIRPLAIIPTYNEAENISTLLDRILAASPDIEALIVDDASPDGTSARVKEHPAFGSRVHLLERAGKLGLGSAYRTGFEWAIAHGRDAVLEIDADFSHDPADIPRLLAALDAGADAAIGSRYLDGVRVINWPEHRLLLSAGASRYVRVLTGLPLTDATSGFKALRTSALREIDGSQLRADGYGFQIELHWLLWTAGFRLVEVPIVFTERRVGQTKMTLGIALEAATRVLQLACLHPSRRAATPQ